MADKSNRGLGSPKMDPAKKAEIQSKGGKVSPQNFANRPTEEVQAIGRKGGQASPGNFRNNRRRAAEAGRKGGLSRENNE